METTGMRCIKYLLFIFNLILFLAGLILILIGALVVARLNLYNVFLGEQFTKAAINIIAVGLFILIIGFFGCCGAVKENSCMIYTFAFLLVMVLILEIAATAVAYVFRHKINDLVSDHLMNDTYYYNDSRNKAITFAWDKAQAEFQCCGAHNYTDWLLNPQLNKTSSVPDSCCTAKEPTVGCGYGKAIGNTTTIFTTGCVKKFNDWTYDNVTIIGGTAAGLAFVQLIGIIISCCLASAIRREYEVV